MANTVRAGMLVPGDTFIRTEADDEREVTAAEVNVLPHRVSVRTTDGDWFAYFPDAKLVLA